MIPQSVKDLLGNTDNAGFFQTLALLIFMIFFIGIVVYVFSRPKKHYRDEEHAPLDDDQPLDL